jgi:hypothetical protein
VSDTPVDCIIGGLAILVFSIMLWCVGRMMDQRLHIWKRVSSARVNRMTATLRAIERFLDCQDQPDASRGPAK